MAEAIVTEQPVIATETDKSADPEIAKIINSAVTSQLKRLLPKAIEQAVSSLKPAQAATDDSVIDKPSSSPELDDMRKQLSKATKTIELLAAREKAATSKARTATLNTELTSSLKGKVNDDFLDIVAERLATKAVFSELDEPSLKFGEDEFSISEGVENYLKDPSNKRFLPAPKGNQSAKPQSTVNRFAPVPGTQNTQAMDPLSPEYESVMAQALQAQGGLLGQR